MAKLVDLLGQTFGKLTVIKKDETCQSTRNSKWVCECECGKVVSVITPSLKSGNTKSCGCLRTGRVTHNQSTTSEYVSWSRMVSQGTRNLVCKSWVKSFPTFMFDMGVRPTKQHSLIRLDATLGFTKENCQWSLGRTKTKPKADKRSKWCKNLKGTHQVGYIKLSLAKWSKALGIPVEVLKKRLREGWTTRKTMETTLEGVRRPIGYSLKSSTRVTID